MSALSLHVLIPADSPRLHLPDEPDMPSPFESSGLGAAALISIIVLIVLAMVSTMAVRENAETPALPASQTPGTDAGASSAP